MFEFYSWLVVIAVLGFISLLLISIGKELENIREEVKKHVPPKN